MADKRVEEYRGRALEAERKAEATTDPEAKRIYWRLADTYKELMGLIEQPELGKKH